MSNSQTHHDRKRVANGAGMAFLGRLGSLFEAASVIAFGWAYGEVTFGLYAVLWSYIRVMTAITDSAMTTGLQRYVPKASRQGANQLAGFALKFSFLLGALFALIITLNANSLAELVNAGDSDKDHLALIIAIYAWTLPFWTLVEVSTASIRAKRTFGPEIKVRIFYEQGLRLLAGLAFAAFGMMSYGLFVAHLVSIILAGGLALRLVANQYDFNEVLKARFFCRSNWELLNYGLSIMPANVIKRLFSEFPVMILNQMLPGAAGAAASGYYAIARKIASVLQLIKLTFEYVIAPLASEKEGQGDRKALQDMFAYATRLSFTFALPLYAALIITRNDILSLMRPEFQAASTAIIILCLGRTLEAASGPSAAIIEMTGNKFLPFLNSFLGLLTLIFLSGFFIESYGVTGAAIAAATGLNVTAWLSLLQAIFTYKLNPYSKLLIKPISWSLILSSLLLSLLFIPQTWVPPYGFIVGVSGFILISIIILRHGLIEKDIAPLGWLAKLAKSA